MKDIGWLLLIVFILGFFPMSDRWFIFISCGGGFFVIVYLIEYQFKSNYAQIKKLSDDLRDHIEHQINLIDKKIDTLKKQGKQVCEN